MQSKRDSAFEAILNSVAGFGLSWLFWIAVINPVFRLHTNPGEGFLITTSYVGLSLVRQFIIRRWLNGKDIL